MNLADALERIRGYVREIEAYLNPKQESPEVLAEKLAETQRRHEKATRERLFRKREHSLRKQDAQIG